MSPASARLQHDAGGAVQPAAPRPRGGRPRSGRALAPGDACVARLLRDARRGLARLEPVRRGARAALRRPRRSRARRRRLPRRGRARVRHAGRRRTGRTTSGARRIRPASCAPRSSLRWTLPAFAPGPTGVEARASRTQSPNGFARPGGRRSPSTPQSGPHPVSLRSGAPAGSRMSCSRRSRITPRPVSARRSSRGSRLRRCTREAGRRVPAILTVTTGAERRRRAGELPPAASCSSGDLVLTDTSPWIDGAWSDSANAVFVGTPDREDAAGASTLSAARCTTGISLCRPGVVARDVDRQVRDLLAEHGPTYEHHTGHGIGATWSEEPRITPYSDVQLEEGMVLALEPAIYPPGLGRRPPRARLRRRCRGQRDPDRVRAHAMKIATRRDGPGQRSVPPPRGQLAGRARRGQRRAREADDGRRARRLGRGVLRRRHGLGRGRAAGDGAVRRRARSVEPRRDAPRRVHARPVAVPGRHRQLRLGRNRHGPVGHLRPGVRTSRSGGCSAGSSRRRRRTSTTSRAARPRASRPRSTTASPPASRSSTSRSASTTPRTSSWSRPSGRRSGPAPRLRLDANGSWTMPQALRNLRALGEHDIDFVEQPVRDHPIGQLAELRARSGAIVCANEGLWSEADAYARIRAREADVYCFSPYWVGSIGELPPALLARALRRAPGLQAHPRRARPRRGGRPPRRPDAAERRRGAPADRVPDGARHPHRADPDRERPALGSDRRAPASASRSTMMPSPKRRRGTAPRASTGRGRTTSSQRRNGDGRPVGGKGCARRRRRLGDGPRRRGGDGGGGRSGRRLGHRARPRRGRGRLDHGGRRHGGGDCTSTSRRPSSCSASSRTRSRASAAWTPSTTAPPTSSSSTRATGA